MGTGNGVCLITCLLFCFLFEFPGSACRGIMGLRWLFRVFWFAYCSFAAALDGVVALIWLAWLLFGLTMT